MLKPKMLEPLDKPSLYEVKAFFPDKMCGADLVTHPIARGHWRIEHHEQDFAEILAGHFGSDPCPPIAVELDAAALWTQSPPEIERLRVAEAEHLVLVSKLKKMRASLAADLIEFERQGVARVEAAVKSVGEPDEILGDAPVEQGAAQ